MHINGLTLLGGAASNFVVWPPTPRGAWGACLPTPCPRTPARAPNPPAGCDDKCVSNKTEPGTLSCLTQTGESSGSVSF